MDHVVKNKNALFVITIVSQIIFMIIHNGLNVHLNDWLSTFPRDQRGREIIIIIKL